MPCNGKHLPFTSVLIYTALIIISLDLESNIRFIRVRFSERIAVYQVQQISIIKHTNIIRQLLVRANLNL